MAEPIAVPALVPPLDEHAADAVLRREVDILFGPRGRRAVVRPLGQAPRPADHSPPDADIFHRLEPTDVAELVGFVGVEFAVVLAQPRRVVCNTHRTPRLWEGQG